MSFSDLPSVSSAAHECNKDCSCPAAKKSSQYDQPQKDRRLENWDEWMVKRRKMHRQIEAVISRDAEDSLQNTFEDKRELNEMKSVMEYTKIPNPHDKYRGNPAFWKMPVALYKHECDSKTYFTTMTKSEKCEIPDIEYVKVPDLIKLEKGSFSWRNTKYWNQMGYYVQRKLDLEESLRHIQPHKPDLASLIVIGRKIVPTVEEENKSVQLEEQQNNYHELEAEVPIRKLQLTINEVNIYDTSRGKSVIEMIFQEAQISQVNTAYLHIINSSDLCFKYNFLPYKQKTELASVIEPQADNVFYFDKNSQVIQPGESCDFPFWNKSDKYGPFHASYEMKLNPDFSHDNLQIVINLNCNVWQSGVQDEGNQITQRLENQAKQRIISEALKDITNKIPRKRSELQLYSYDKATIFEAMNSVYDPIHFRPKYLYDKPVVDELEAFYDAVKLPKHPEVWDCRIDTLRVVTRDRENTNRELALVDELDAVKTKIDAAKLQRADLQEKERALWLADNAPKKDAKPENKAAPSKEAKDGHSKEKTDVKSDEPVREPLPKTLSDNLNDIIMKLRSPTTWKLEHNRRLKLCYTLLSAYIDKICDEVANIERTFNITRPIPKSRKTCNVNKGRIYDEKVDDSKIEVRKFMERSRTRYVKAPEWTQHLSIDDYEGRFKEFHGGKVGKTGQKDEKGAKGAKLKTESKSSWRETSSGIQLPTPEEMSISDSIVDEATSISSDIQDHYNNNIYLSFYFNLQQFIDDLVSLYELESQPSIPQDILNRIHNSQFDKLQVDSDVKIHVFDLKKVVSDMLKWKGDPTELDHAQKLVPKFVPEHETDQNSVWNLLKAYYPKEPKKSPSGDDMYVLPTKAYPAEMRDACTEVDPDEVILERNMQTSICGSDSVEFKQDIKIDRQICECKSEERIVTSTDRLFEYYDSKSSLTAAVSASSSDVNENIDDKKHPRASTGVAKGKLFVCKEN